MSVALLLGGLTVLSAPSPASADHSGTTQHHVAASAITGGDGHTCVVTRRGHVRCWGDNTYGQLGYGNTESFSETRVPAVAGDIRLGGLAVAVSAGERHTCALMRNGRVRCWGDNTFGQLGYGNSHSIGDDEDPADAGDLRLGGTAVAIASGARHTCAVMTTGAVRCWGSGSEGKLGNGNTRTIGDNEVPATLRPIQLGGTAVAVDAGRSHSCALLANGRVRCWGSSGMGQLGHGNTDAIGDDETPASAGNVPLGGTATAIGVAGSTSCALLSGGGVRCWGWGDSGRLGYGNLDNVGDDETPASVGNVPLGGTAIALSVGSATNCALLKRGAVRCWGPGSYGLGYGNTEDIGDDETPASAGDIDLGAVPIALAGGSEHHCAVMGNGTARCWGWGGSGRLGYGSESGIGGDETPAQAGTVVVGGPAAQVAAGDGHTCALRESGAIRCWGWANAGQLGYGDSIHHSQPNALDDVPVGGAATAIALGGWHSCALLDTGAVRCWGMGTSGRTGHGNTEDIGDDETPASAGDLELGGVAVSLSAGEDHTCAILTDHSLRCWGWNYEGQLGYAHTSRVGDDETPAAAGAVEVGGPVAAVAAGGDHTCALLQGGTVRCWGEGAAGQLGHGNTDSIGDDETPASAGDIDLGGTAVAVSAGTSHSCALLDTGAVRCWGSNAHGELGYGRVDDIGDDETPASAGDIDLGGRAVTISSGGGRTCAVLESGAARCWGSNAHGELGYGRVDDIGDDETPASAGDLALGGAATSISAGVTHNCALLAGGWVRCWGGGGLGQLGYANNKWLGDDETPFVPDLQIGALILTKGSPLLTARATPHRDRRSPYAFKITGSLETKKVEAFPRDPGTCRGAVTMALSAGKKKLLNRRATINDSCDYATKITVRFAALPKQMRRRIKNTKNPGTLSLKLSFTGTPDLRPAAKTIKLKVG